MPSGYSSLGGQVLNPYDTSVTPSGSSSGSATAVALGLAPAAVGTETDGSITSPSEHQSLVGMKPTARAREPDRHRSRSHPARTPRDPWPARWPTPPLLLAAMAGAGPRRSRHRAVAGRDRGACGPCGSNRARCGGARSAVVRRTSRGRRAAGRPAGLPRTRHCDALAAAAPSVRDVHLPAVPQVVAIERRRAHGAALRVRAGGRRRTSARSAADAPRPVAGRDRRRGTAATREAALKFGQVHVETAALADRPRPRRTPTTATRAARRRQSATGRSRRRWRRARGPRASRVSRAADLAAAGRLAQHRGAGRLRRLEPAPGRGHVHRSAVDRGPAALARRTRSSWPTRCGGRRGTSTRPLSGGSGRADPQPGRAAAVAAGSVALAAVQSRSSPSLDAPARPSEPGPDAGRLGSAGCRSDSTTWSRSTRRLRRSPGGSRSASSDPTAPARPPPCG